MEEEEESSRPCVECEVPRELLLHTDQLMPPLEILFERFEENELDSATIPEKESEQQNSTVDTMSVLIKREPTFIPHTLLALFSSLCSA